MDVTDLIRLFYDIIKDSELFCDLSPAELAEACDRWIAATYGNDIDNLTL